MYLFCVDYRQIKSSYLAISGLVTHLHLTGTVAARIVARMTDTAVPKTVDSLWEPPPEKSQKSFGVPGVWVTRLAPCSERPGEWLKIGPFPGAKRGGRHASNLKKGLIKLPAGTWEFTSSGDNVSDLSWVFARLVLDDSNSEGWSVPDGEHEDTAPTGPAETGTALTGTTGPAETGPELPF